MTEYRIVCDREMSDPGVLNGKVRKYIATEPLMSNGSRSRTVYTEKEKAEFHVARIKAECEQRAFLMKKYPVVKGAWEKQYNIRIQTREVTEWADA